MWKMKSVLALLVMAALELSVSGGEEKTAPQFESAQGMVFAEFKADSYPSLVAYDVDKDGTLELISSGVRGRLTISKRAAAGVLKWIDHKPWMDIEGKQIDFHNW